MIELNNLTKVYKGNILAVNKLSFKVSKGSILGFVGPNGAGKTTTIRMLIGLLKPTTGTARVNGYDVKTELSEVKKSIGYLPQDFGLYSFMKVEEYLDFVCKFYSIITERKKLQQQVLETVGLLHLFNRRIRTLSTGEKQRLGIAQAILHNPDIIFLDEPTSSLDPIGRQEVYQVLTRLIKEGKTIFISSHILAELVKVITDLVIIKSGSLLFSGSVKKLISQYAQRQQRQFRLCFDLLDEDLLAHIQGASWVQHITRLSNNEIVVEVDDVKQAKLELIQLIANSNSVLNTFSSTNEDIEKIIINLIT
ncbi:MAG: ABC transporter ATP-binding protein [Candidatus Heimdallarchaeota archaeon]